MKVAVFGSANAIEGDDLYDLAYQLGKLLAEAAHTVMTGGYCGTMGSDIARSFRSWWAYDRCDFRRDRSFSPRWTQPVGA